MACVYILYSAELDKFYIGSCENFTERNNQHLQKQIEGSFTTKASDWVVHVLLSDLTYFQARKIESHIKKMKSRRFIVNLARYPEMARKLIERYS
jgi:putative endonuclease